MRGLYPLWINLSTLRWIGIWNLNVFDDSTHEWIRLRYCFGRIEEDFCDDVPCCVYYSTQTKRLEQLDLSERLLFSFHFFLSVRLCVKLSACLIWRTIDDIYIATSTLNKFFDHVSQSTITFDSLLCIPFSQSQPEHTSRVYTVQQRREPWRKRRQTIIHNNFRIDPNSRICAQNVFFSFQFFFSWLYLV